MAPYFFWSLGFLHSVWTELYMCFSFVCRKVPGGAGFISWFNVNFFPISLPPVLIKQFIGKTIKWNTSLCILKCSQFREDLWFWSSFAFCSLSSLQEEGHLTYIIFYIGLEPPVIQALRICIPVVLPYIMHMQNCQ